MVKDLVLASALRRWRRCGSDCTLLFSARRSASRKRVALQSTVKPLEGYGSVLSLSCQLPWFSDRQIALKTTPTELGMIDFAQQKIESGQIHLPGWPTDGASTRKGTFAVFERQQTDLTNLFSAYLLRRCPEKQLNPPGPIAVLAVDVTPRRCNLWSGFIGGDRCVPLNAGDWTLARRKHLQHQRHQI